MTPTRLLPVSLVLSLAALGFDGVQPTAAAACDVNLVGYCEGDCDVNVLATCYGDGDCLVNAYATCGSWDASGYASCGVNAVLADCQGQCFVNAADATCGQWASCFANAGMADCYGWCAVNAGLAWCTGGCLVNAAASCESTSCVAGTGGPARVEPVCFLWGCTVNAALAECDEGGRCTVNVAADCSGACAVNVAGPSPYLRSSILYLGCGETGECTVNAAARCDGACTVNAVLATCEQYAACMVNVVSTCRVIEAVLP
jgi:hypothetical protein